MMELESRNRYNAYITINDVAKTLREWSDYLNIDYNTLYARHSRGATGEDLIKPLQEKYSHKKPDFYFNQGLSMTTEEKEYLCYYFDVDHVLTLSYALGRTQTALNKAYKQMSKKGLVEDYKQRYRLRLMGEIE